MSIRHWRQDGRDSTINPMLVRKQNSNETALSSMITRHPKNISISILVRGSRCIIDIGICTTERLEVLALRGKMPRPRVWLHAGARCPAYAFGVARRDKKMSRLRVWRCAAGQDVPPTGLALRGGARCPAYGFGAARWVKMPRPPTAIPTALSMERQARQTPEVPDLKRHRSVVHQRSVCPDAATACVSRTVKREGRRGYKR